MSLERRGSEISFAGTRLEVAMLALEPTINGDAEYLTLWDRVLAICDQYLPRVPERFAAGGALGS